jgi:hypothetical protein
MCYKSFYNQILLDVSVIVWGNDLLYKTIQYYVIISDRFIFVYMFVRDFQCFSC